MIPLCSQLSLQKLDIRRAKSMKEDKTPPEKIYAAFLDPRKPKAE